MYDVSYILDKCSWYIGEPTDYTPPDPEDEIQLLDLWRLDSELIDLAMDGWLDEEDNVVQGDVL